MHAQEAGPVKISKTGIRTLDFRLLLLLLSWFA